MTNKTLREQLPQGCARNKIEYLADEFEAKSAELAALIAGLGSSGAAPTLNLLSNSHFNENMELAPQITYMRSLPTGTVDLNRTLDNGRNAMMVTADWAAEVPHGADNVSGFKVERMTDSSYNYFGEALDRDSGILSYFSNEFTLYQVLTVPMNGYHHRKLKGCFALTGAAGMEVTVGVASLYQDNVGNVHVSRYMGEKTTIFNKTDLFLPVTVESNEIDITSQGSAGLMAFYIKVKKSGGSGRVYSAHLWHSQTGEAPTAFENRHNPYAYDRFFGFRNITANEATILEPNVIKWAFPRSLNYLFNPKHHMATHHINVHSAQIIDIQPGAITMKYSEEDFNARIVNQHGQVYQLLRLQYSAMPFGLGFYR